jgi:hypothetical protein
MKQGAGPPPGFHLPTDNDTISAMVEIAKRQQSDKTTYKLLISAIPWYLWVSVALTTVLIILALARPKRTRGRKASSGHTLEATSKIYSRSIILLTLAAMLFNYGFAVPSLKDYGWNAFAAYYDSCSLLKV